MRRSRARSTTPRAARRRPLPRRSRSMSRPSVTCDRPRRAPLRAARRPARSHAPRHDRHHAAERIGSRHAARHDRPGPDGREHRAQADARRPHLRRLRRQPGRRRGARRRGSDGREHARGLRRQARRPAPGVDHGPGRRDHRDDGQRARRAPRARATRSSTAATPTTGTTSAAPPSSASAGSTTSTAARAGACSASIAASASWSAAPTTRSPRSSRSSPLSLRAWTQPSARPAATGEPAPEERGYLHCGQAGAGHFVKMVHNGIEYGMMAALAEGLNVLHGADAGLRPRDQDAETAPLDHPEFYSYSLDIPAISEVWRRGSVVESWLLDLTAAALQESPDLERLRRTRVGLGRGPLDRDRGDRGGRARPTFSPPRSTRASRHVTRGSSRTRCCRRCGSSSAATTRSPPHVASARTG